MSLFWLSLTRLSLSRLTLSRLTFAGLSFRLTLARLTLLQGIRSVLQTLKCVGDILPNVLWNARLLRLTGCLLCLLCQLIEVFGSLLTRFARILQLRLSQL